MAQAQLLAKDPITNFGPIFEPMRLSGRLPGVVNFRIGDLSVVLTDSEFSLLVGYLLESIDEEQILLEKLRSA
jgi:hypothetical protein